MGMITRVNGDVERSRGGVVIGSSRKKKCDLNEWLWKKKKRVAERMARERRGRRGSERERNVAGGLNVKTE